MKHNISYIGSKKVKLESKSPQTSLTLPCDDLIPTKEEMEYHRRPPTAAEQELYETMCMGKSFDIKKGGFM